MAMERLRPMFAKWGEPQFDLFATFASRRLIKFVSPYPDHRAEWTDAMSMLWDNGSLLCAFPPFKMVPQVLQKIAQSPGVKVSLIAPLQQAASWFPELMDLSQEDPIPLFVEGQDLLTQDVVIGDRVTETRHYRPSNLHAWKLYRMLCPVRQLKLYIRDSERILGGRQRMFVHWNRNIKDIMRSHISRWIVETVKEAYTQADREYDRVTAHEVRALSASWTYNCQVALPDILSAAFWRSSGVFQNSYLRDMACIADGMSTLGPVVVTQQVVDPGHLHPPP